MTVEQLYEKLSSPVFQDPKNGDLFYNFFIYQYPASDEHEIRRQIQTFKENLKRPSAYVEALTLDLFDEFCKFLDSQSFGNLNPSLLKFLMEQESKSPENIQKVLTQQANSRGFFEYIHRRIMEFVNINDGMKRTYVFIYGVGDIFPYLRTNVFLTNYERYNETDKYKLIVFYPGHRVDNTFSLFDKLNDANTYRAVLLINNPDE